MYETDLVSKTIDDALRQDFENDCTIGTAQANETEIK